MLLYPLSGLILIRSVWVGLGMWVVLLQEPRLALVALVALLIGEPVGRSVSNLLRLPLDTMTRVNMLLGALVGGWLAIPTGLALPFVIMVIATLQAMALLASFLLRQVLQASGLPVLIFPYCLVATIVFTIAPLAVWGASAHFKWPFHDFSTLADLPMIFAESMGVFLFSPSVLSGALIVVLLAIYSPLMLLAGIVGWTSGAVTALALANLGIFFYWELTSFNYFLAGMAVGAVFFVPSIGSFSAAVIAGITAAFVAAFIQNILAVPGLSVLPFTFVVSLYSTLTITRGSGLRRSNDWFNPPEERLLKSDWLTARWGDYGTPLLAVPVPGQLVITQGFCGPITHREEWQHALDFERPISCGIDGIWESTVYSPIIGSVVDTQDSIPDNPLGSANYGENWGNYVLLRADVGYYVQLSHLKQGTLQVQQGQRVGFSTPLAKVGNSGRSIISHLHLQAQTQPIAGSQTTPFRLANYVEHDPVGGDPKRWRATGVPTEGQVIAAAVPNWVTHKVLTSITPGRSIWTVETEGDAPGWFRPRQPLVLTTSLTTGGHYVMRAADGDWLEARLETDGWRLEGFDARPGSLIATLVSAMSLIPYCAFPGLRWNDSIPTPLPPVLRAVRKKVVPMHSERLLSSELSCLRCTADDEPTLRIATQVLRVPAFSPQRCEVEIVGRRGPVAAVWRHGGTRVSYTAISFTPSM